MRVAGLVLVALLAGCATSQPSDGEIRTAPASSILAYGKPPQDGPYTTVTFTRDTGWIGAGRSLTLFVDGKSAVRLDTAERATLYIPSGNVILGVGCAGGPFCSESDRRERDAVLPPGEMRSYRLFTDENGLLDVLPTTIR